LSIVEGFFQNLSGFIKLRYLPQSQGINHSYQIEYLGIFYSVDGPLAIYFSLQDAGFVEDVEMFGYGGLRSLEGREDLSDATRSLREIFQQLQPGGV